MPRKFLISIVLFSFLLTLSLILVDKNNFSQASVTEWQKGANISPSTSEDFSSPSFKQSLINLKNTGANYVTYVIQLYQDSVNTSDIYISKDAPSDDSLGHAIDLAHSLGLKVMLKPHVDIPNSNIWRAHISPDNKQLWFENYTSILDKYLRIATEHNVEEFCIGTELISLTSSKIDPQNNAYWENLIAHIRTEYGGKLTYASNPGSVGTFRDETLNIQFWNDLDYIGVDGYFDYVTHKPKASIEELTQGFEYWNNEIIKPIESKYNKPILFTEIGYKSVYGANTSPGNYQLQGNVDQTEQALDYEAFFKYWSNFSYIAGMQIWNWQTAPYAGGASDTDYTPQNKLAQSIMTQWYTNNFDAKFDFSPPLFNIAATYLNTISPQTNQPIVITSNISNDGGEVNGVIVDFEIYNSENKKVFQKYFSSQEFTPNSTNVYDVLWTPLNAGNYKVQVGIFNNDWTQTFLWNQDTLSIDVNNNINIHKFNIATLKVNPEYPSINQLTNITASIQNTGNTLRNVIVDFEIYDSSNNKIFQKYFVNQNLIANKAQNYNFQWTPSDTESYTLSIGIFSENWGNNLYWNSNIGNININSNSQSNITVWWPMNDSILLPNQVIKAALNNRDINSYNMYWQLDDGKQTLMNNNIVDIPHKESLINTSTLKNISKGIHTLNIISKDLNNKFISQSSVQIEIDN